MQARACAPHEHAGKDSVGGPDEIGDGLQTRQVSARRVGQDGPQGEVVEAGVTALGPELGGQLQGIVRKMGERLRSQAGGLHWEACSFQGSPSLAGQLACLVDGSGLGRRIAGVDETGHRADIHGVSPQMRLSCW